jgi:hypothetical protein
LGQEEALLGARKASSPMEYVTS